MTDTRHAATTYPQKGLTMVDDGWKGGTEPQAYVDSLKQDALTMVDQEAQRLADLICGCATKEQNRKDVAEIKAALIAAEARGMAAAAKIADECVAKGTIAACNIGKTIRAALNGGQHEQDA